jgi:dihydrodipicolinate synthase/N-acetylneuraminate lyase
MNTQPCTPERLAASVIAVPPLARDANLAIHPQENLRIIRHLEAGGVRTLLYGGNAALAHVALSEYGTLLKLLAESAGPETTVVPSFGPSYGQMLDQVEVLRDFQFPTVMLLPSREGLTSAGLAGGIRRAVDRLGRPMVLYIKHDGMIDVDTTARLVADGLISWIKYAVVRPDPAQDPFLKDLLSKVDAKWIVSGMGEQPTIAHLHHDGLIGFTSGCVCVAPALSMQMLTALKAGDLAKAEAIRQTFAPLETLRDNINPVRVLHAAVKLAGIAETGPVTPFWSPVAAADEPAIAAAARTLLAANAV